jgi:hypothetical protein
MKSRDDADYYHLAAASDEAAGKALSSQDFFKRYQEQSRLAAGGQVEVTPLETIAQTELRA